MYKLHTSCRACGYAEPSGPPGIKAEPTGEQLIEVFDLGLQPLANDFCADDQEHAGFFPLKVLMCPRCKLAQLSVTVSPRVLYANYNYVTAQGSTMREHFSSLWHSIKDRQPDCVNVLEIGSNDGTFLSFLKKSGAEHVLGIDPAESLTRMAHEKGVMTICGLFDEATANTAAQAMPQVDAVIARHVFCHIDDWRDFVKTLDLICQKDTIVCIEVPYVMDLLRNVQFDTIYHEHLSLLNIGALQALLRNTVFKLDHIQHFPIHGGAIAIYLRRRDHNENADDSVEWYLDQENRRLNVETWREFTDHAQNNIFFLRDKVSHLVGEGKTVCGFGASAKSTVWINACKFTRKELKFITDTTPQKLWKLSPGSDICVVDEGALLRELPDYAVMFAWNFKNEILQKNSLYLQKGGSFIIPVPQVEIYSIK